MSTQPKGRLMAFLSRQDLKFDYQWSAIPPDDARVTGAPDNLLLNRREGQEVLAFLNKTSASEDGALKAERLIRNHLPGEVRGRKNVLDWLRVELDDVPVRARGPRSRVRGLPALAGLP
jgi:hypothetical protein